MSPPLPLSTSIFHNPSSYLRIIDSSPDLQNSEDSSSPASKVETMEILKPNRLKRWLLVAMNIIFLIAGQTAAVLLGRYYYEKGGNSTFMATLVQAAGFPILFIPLLLLPLQPNGPLTLPNPPPKSHVYAVYIVGGVLVAGDNYLYALGLSYLSASTYSLICTTQLVFNVIFSYLLNSQKLTSLILNSVIVVTFSAALLAVNQDSDTPPGVSRAHYALSFVATLAASALYSLLLSLMQLGFQKILKRQTFRVVLEVQIWVSVVATAVTVVALFISGQWRDVSGEMRGFQTGRASYVMTLVWTAVCWQICSVGILGLIFLVSSLFSNVISTVALAVSPIAAVIFLHDTMNGIKIIAMLQAFWGLGSYTYQEYLDDLKNTRPPDVRPDARQGDEDA